MNLNDLFETNEQNDRDLLEGRVKELSMDLEDPLMSDEEFETKYGDSRANMQGRAGRVQDRKTGRFYDPEQEFDKLKNSPEFGAQMRRMAQQDGVTEGDVFRRHGKNRNPTIAELEMWIKNWTSFQIGGNLTDAGRAKVGQSIAKAQRLLAKKKQQQGVAESKIQYGVLDHANVNLIIDKSENKPDGVYSFRGILFRVKGGRVTHYATDGKILQAMGRFNTQIGSYATNAEAKALLKSIKEGVAEGRATYGPITANHKAAAKKAFAAGERDGKAGAEKNKQYMSSALMKTTYLNGYKQGKQGVAEGSEYKSRHAHKQEQDKAYNDYRTKHATSSLALMTRAEFAKYQRERAAKKKQGVAEAALKGTAEEYAARAQAAEAKYLKYEDLVDQELQKLGQRLPQSWDAGRMNTKLSSHPKYALALKYYTLSEKFASQAIRYERLAKKQGMAEGSDIGYHQTSGTKAGYVVSSRKLSNKPQASKSDVTLQSGSMHHRGKSYNFPKGTLFTQLPGGIFAKHPDVPETAPGYGHVIRKNEDNINRIHAALNGAPDVTETALRDKADLVAKRRALQDLSRDPGVDQKAVQQRQQDLEKEAKAKDLAESLLDEFAAGLDSDDLAEDNLPEAKMSPQQQNDFDRMRYGAMSRKEYDARWKKPQKSDDQVIYGKKPGVAEQNRVAGGSVAKKPQPYHDPNWIKNLPKEKLDAIRGKKYQKPQPGIAEDSKEKSDPWTDPKLKRKMDYAFGHYAGYKDRPEAFFKWVMQALEHSEQQDQEHEERFQDIDRAISSIKKRLDAAASQKNLPVSESREIKKQIVANILKESRL